MSTYPLAPRRAAFIDRDGVINEERGFVHKGEDFVLLPGTVDALRGLQEAGYLLVVVTNQSGIARGLYTEAQYHELTADMMGRLELGGVRLSAVEYCPHLPDAPLEPYRKQCDCRKPLPGMLLRAAARLDVDLQGSLLIGDRGSDIQAGRAAGVGRCYLVRSGCPLTAEDVAGCDGVYENLDDCVKHLLVKARGMDPCTKDA